jgi:DNA polymerase-1
MYRFRRLTVERRPVWLAVCADSDGEGERVKRFPGYKADRDVRPLEFYEQRERVNELLSLHSIPIFIAAGLEADDTIAAATAKALEDGLRVVIVSKDKDLAALVSDRVLLWNFGDARAMGRDDVIASFGVPPEHVSEWLALAGDPGDRIPGVPKVGKERAAELLSTFGSVSEILRVALEEPGRIRWPSVRASLSSEEGQSAARLSLDLSRLRRPAIPWDRGRLRVGAWDIEGLRETYRDLGFSDLEHVSAPNWLASPDP